MKLNQWLAILLIAVFGTVGYGQQIKGIATYKTQRKVDVQLDSTSMADGMHDQIMAMLKKQFEKEYTLEFTEDESIYKEVPKLDNPNPMPAGGGTVMVQVVGSGDSDVLYKNLTESRYVNQNEMFSKQFLIKDSLQNREWVMEKETKNIGNYTCFKATTTYERTVRSSMSSNDNGDTDETTNEREETVTLTAWYTPQIPVKNGPQEYHGLPGLILEISDGDLSILCSKVVLNPADGLTIKEPKGGKEVDQEEYDAIMEKKMKEMEETWQTDGRRGNSGRNVEIRIGG